MIHRLKHFLFSVCLRRSIAPSLFAVAWVALTGYASAQTSYMTPELMNYEGTLRGATGAALPDGNYNIEFRIYNVATGGTASEVVWGPIEFDGEAGNGHSQEVVLVNGRFNAILGPVDTLNRNLLNSLQLVAGTNTSLYLELTVEGTALAPRQLMLSTAFAMVASNGFPRGSIVIYAGEAAPPGWAFCDGTNGTPDMRDRFVKGAGGTGFDQIGTQAGAGSHTHVLPSHSHTTTHNHSLQNHTHTIAGHTHTVDPPSTTSSTASNNSSIINGGLGNWDFAKSHSHTLDIASFNSSANSTETTGGPSTANTQDTNTANATSPVTPSQTHEPPFYALAYIMKL